MEPVKGVATCVFNMLTLAVSTAVHVTWGHGGDRSVIIITGSACPEVFSTMMISVNDTLHLVCIFSLMVELSEGK